MRYRSHIASCFANECKRFGAWLGTDSRTAAAVQFLLKLMKRQCFTSIDPTTKELTLIYPYALAQQVLALRELLAVSASQVCAWCMANTYPSPRELPGVDVVLMICTLCRRDYQHM